MTAFKLPDVVRTAPYTAPAKGGLFIDSMTANHGYVTAGCIGSEHKYNRLKFQVRKGDQAYNYDLPQSAEPIRCPMNMGNGSYLLRVMERVEGNQYAQVMAVEKQVKLISRLVPYTIPTVFCNYDTHGPCVRVARYVAAACDTELDVLDAVTKWVAGYVSYDYDKAEKLSSSVGYAPSPDRTLKERIGVCFDYASVEAAMLRSMDIPCRVITGYVNNDAYHAWVSAHVDGKWLRRDPTLMSVSSKTRNGDMPIINTYKNRFVY